MGVLSLSRIRMATRGGDRVGGCEGICCTYRFWKVVKKFFFG